MIFSLNIFYCHKQRDRTQVIKLINMIITQVFQWVSLPNLGKENNKLMLGL